MADAYKNWEGSPESISYRPQKGAFLGLLLLSTAGFVAAGFFFWYVPAIGLGNIHPMLPYLTGAILGLFALFVFGSAAILTITVAKGRLIFYSGWLRWMLIKFFLPIMVMAGAWLRIPRIRLEQAFIDVNNEFVRRMKKRLRPEKLVLLMPHCLQFDNCRIKVTRDVKNCAGCGKCEIGSLVGLMEEFKVSLYVLTGGSVARRKIEEHKPHAIIAVACERDLTSGVQDAYPLPVMAIINKRPKGYCIETTVDVNDVRKALVDLLSPA
ncbi:MAG: DUF116 domain-containing protein [Deltaproteobacteria bacterium]